MKKVTYESYALHTSSQARTADLISCYKQVFAAPPWNEDWWTDALVYEVLEKYAGPQARMILAVSACNVIGFAWGSVETAKDLSNELELELPHFVSDKVGYIKDIGVCAEFREQGIATALLGQLMSILRESCAPSDWVLARTLAKPEPSVVFRWFPLVGFKEVTYYSDYSARSGQVILGNTFETVSL